MNDLVTRARLFATEAHKGQFRKQDNENGERVPYITHPAGVAAILEEAGRSPEEIAAGFLHDTLEDTSVTAKDIQREFGDTVLRIVLSNTEPDKSLSWEERKTHTIKKVLNASLDEKALIAADKLDNLRSIRKGAEQMGEDVWKLFKRGREQQAWYYHRIANGLLNGLQEEEIPPFFLVFIEEVHEFFGN